VNKFLLFLLLFSSQSFAEFFPKTTKDFYNTSVRIYNLEQNSGGTGSIFRSYKEASYILTNKHVCRLIEPGGFVQYKNQMIPISHYKKFPHHDLCLVRIEENLNINLKVAESLAQISDTAHVSGHPNLLPHIVTKGHLSEHIDIELVIGIKECTTEDIKQDPVACAWFGGKPVIEQFDSQVVSNLIKPGSSGSAVFNDNGELIGVVFAGSGRDFSHGFIVPHLYLLYFTQNSNRFKWVKVGTPVDDGGMSGRIFNFDKCENPKIEINDKLKSVKNICKQIKDNILWMN